MTKEIFRKLLKAKLSLIDKKNFSEKSSLISMNLNQLTLELGVIQKKIIVGAFAPIGKEPFWHLDFSKELEHFTAYPAMSVNSERMIFKMARMNDLLITKDFGFAILGPPHESPEVIPGLIFVPGLGFTEKGDRLGRGKGFYDKYLSHYRGIKIGICFSEQLEKVLPTEQHDMTLDYIVTDKKIINCKYAQRNNEELV